MDAHAAVDAVAEREDAIGASMDVEAVGLVELDLVAVDFERTRVGEALAASRYEAARPALFTWMGVVGYLTREAFEQTLGDVASLAAPGSRIRPDNRAAPERKAVRWCRVGFHTLSG